MSRSRGLRVVGRRGIALGIFLWIAAAAPATAQQAGSDAAAATAAVNAFHAGIRDGDASAVAQLIAEDALMLEAGGAETRAEYLKNHLPADIEFEKTVSIKRSPIRIIINGATAWATSTSEYSGTFQGKPVDSIGAELMVLTRELAGWRIRAIHWSGRARKPTGCSPNRRTPHSAAWSSVSAAARRAICSGISPRSSTGCTFNSGTSCSS
jgi:ketosteroid isomerase-like protein